MANDNQNRRTPPVTRPDWMKASRVAREMDCSVRTVKQWIAEGKVIAVQTTPNGEWRINRASLEAWLESLRSRCFDEDAGVL